MKHIVCESCGGQDGRCCVCGGDGFLLKCGCGEVWSSDTKSDKRGWCPDCVAFYKPKGRRDDMRWRLECPQDGDVPRRLARFGVFSFKWGGKPR